MLRKQVGVAIAACMLLAAVSSAFAADGDALPEIYCNHFFYGYPVGTPATNDLIIRDLYAMSSNDATKFADWVAYRLDPHTVYGFVDPERKWRNDPWLDEEETLEAIPETGDDYKNASVEGYDRGHQAPLASFKGTVCWAEADYYSNLTPQRKGLNQGPWMRLENGERAFVKKGNVLYCITGPLYERDMPPLPKADEPHKVPSGYWKIIAFQEGKTPSSSPIHIAAFIFDQDTARGAEYFDSLTTVDEIETRSGLDFMWLLPDDIEAALEGTKGEEWARRNLASSDEE